MRSVTIVGIKDHQDYETWKHNTQKALGSLSIRLTIEEVNDVTEIMKHGLSAIPALIADGEVLLEQNQHIPSVFEIKKAIQNHLDKIYFKMKNILVPTDFSQTASNAYEYAEDLAEVLGSRLTVTHVFYPNVDTGHSIIIPPVEELMKAKEEQLKDFVHTRRSDSIQGAVAEALIEHKLCIGFAGEELSKMTKNPDEVNLVVMGTTGESGILEQIFGSVSSSVAQNARCPVWLVPPKTKFKGIRNILYASNYDSADKNMLQKITDLANRFNAKIHLVHVNEGKKKGDYEFEELLLEKIFSRKAGSDMKMNTVQSDSVVEGLYRYASEMDIDLIVIVTRHRKFLENLRHKSMTKKMVLSASTPLLILHLDD